MSTTRRNFLKVTSLTGTGLLLSAGLTPQSLWAKSTPALLNIRHYIHLTEEGEIIYWFTRTEMGQGVKTTLPMILADELEVDVEKITVKMPTPFTTKKRYPMATGGSYSVAGWYPYLRLFGATAREMLVNAAAKIWKVNPKECVVKNGVVVHKKTRRKLSYGQLVKQAAQLPVPQKPTLKSSKDFRYIGKSRQGVDNEAIVQGKLTYGIDVQLDNMLYGVIERSPTVEGTVKSFDDTEARKVKGVVDIFAVPGTSYQSYNFVREGVAVVATNTWAAMKARKKLKVQWNLGEYQTTSTEKLKEEMHKRLKKPGLLGEEVGNVTKATKEAIGNFTATYEVPLLAHAPLEPMNTVAWITHQKCEVWSPTQKQTRLHEAIVQMTGFPKKSVIVHSPERVGGGFGRRLDVDYGIEAVNLAKRVRQPVKLLWTREDGMRFGFNRPQAVHQLSGTWNAEKQMTSFQQRYATLSVWTHQEPYFIAKSNGIDNAIMSPARAFPYDIPNKRYEQHLMSFPIPLGWWRGVASTILTFVQETFVDELAHQLGKDPYQFRVDMLKKGDSFSFGDKKIERDRLLRTLEVAAKKIGWGKKLGKSQGLGISCGFFENTYVTQIIQISVQDKKIKPEKVVSVMDCGLAVNPDKIKAQMEGSIIFGLTAALKGEIRVENGQISQSNFHDYQMVRMSEAPDIESYLLESEHPPNSVGEAAVPPIFAAVGNAIFAATGKRLRRLPFEKDLEKKL